MTKRIRTTRRLEVWLKDTSVALFVLNVQRRLVFFNVGCENLTGWTAAEVLGRICHYLTETDSQMSEALLASLAAPSEAWSGQTTTIPTLLARRNQKPVACVVHFYPLTDADHKVQAILGIIQESTSTPTQIPILKSQRLHLELAELRLTLHQEFADGSLVGRSPAIRRALGQLNLAKKSNVPVLFVGETGTGRQHMARQIHYSSNERQSAFVPLDCQRLPADQLAATWKRLTGLQRDESRHPGVVYFEHLEELPRELQFRVVEMIESGTSKSPRVMAATRVPLEPFVESDKLIRELYFAITPLTIFVPPLRNRMEDLEPLAQYFLEELNRDDSRQITGFHDSVWQQFHRYHWPGNVQELKRVVTEARHDSTGPMIEIGHLPFSFRTGVDRQSIGPITRQRAEPLDQLLLKVEKEQIEIALAEAKHNKAKAAEFLGITRPRLYRRMEILGIVDDHEGESIDETLA